METPEAASGGRSGITEAMARKIGLTVVMLVLLALVAWALGVRGEREAARRTLQGVAAAAAASALAESGTPEQLGALAGWLSREAGYRSVAFVNLDGRVVAGTDANLSTADPPTKAEPAEHSGAMWAPVRRGTGTQPTLWLRVVPGG
jgi:hypothetical protein